MNPRFLTLIHVQPFIKGRIQGGFMGGELLSVNDLHVSVEGKEIIKGLSLTIKTGEIHAIMGRNGSGKSTLANVIMGHPAFEITSGTVEFNGTPIEEMEVFERARAGMFLSCLLYTSPSPRD